MKKLLLTLLITVSFFTGRAQFAFNEVYARPGGSDDEFFEIYNNAVTFVPINTDCYSIVTYWNKGSNWGWYVIDLGDNTINPGQFFVVASSTNFNYQAGSSTAGFSWTALPASGSIQKFQYNSGTNSYDPATITDNKDVIEDISGGAGYKNLVLIYRGSTLIQGLVTGTNSNIFSLAVANPPSLTVSTNGACTSQTFAFNNLSGNPLVQTASAASGTNNGYSRLFDGNCAPWQKSSAGAEHTPGASNNNNGSGGASPYDGAVNTTQGFVIPVACVTQTSANFFYRVNSPTTYSGAAAEGSVFPMTVMIFNDNTPNPAGGFFTAPNQIYDPGVDVMQHTDTYNSSAALFADQTKLVTDPTKLMDIIIVYFTASGCYDKVFAYGTSCATLPVEFKSFTAARSRSNVLLKWETSSEINNSGFAVERNMNGTWEQIAFVNSQATNGNSDHLLTYTYNDLNNTKGITQYRVKQVDFDNKSKYTEVRSVRGLDQIGKVTVFPNPTNDGRVNVVFDDASVNRSISVTDMSGRLIKQINNISTNNITIDNLVPGMYSLRIIVPETGEQTVQKIVVNKR